MSNNANYNEAVNAIKYAILQSQYDAAKTVNEKQLMLYYGIGKYISLNSRNGFWGQGAIEAISEQLSRELPGLRGFTSRNLRYMRTFYEEWKTLDSINAIENKEDNLELASSELNNNLLIPIWNLQVPNCPDFPMDAFLHIGFTHHRIIIGNVKNIEERLFYIKRCAEEHFTVEALQNSISADDYHHQGVLPNNFKRTLSVAHQALKAVSAFKDEYLIDFINTEELNVRDINDIDEKVIENAIIHNIKNFILTFGKDFAFIQNQYHLDAFGEDQYIDLLFFNRELNCLVAVELKKGKFKTSYLGQLQGYLSILDGYERKSHENPAIGIILCKDMNKSFVDYVIQDYTKPMGVATYKTSKDMSEKLRKALPDIEELKKLLNDENE
ncbi:MAG: DUF1016 family protein [Oscillospiraceae bacterium]|nr:DUF1016 family protein [Oscillospiraceae bacterium]